MSELAASGYGTETTWESIYNVAAAAVDATRFGNLNVHIGRQFNFYITGDSETDITDTKVTGMLAAETHQLIFELYNRARSSSKVNPWDFMVVELGRIDFRERYKNLIKKAIDVLYGRMEMVTRNLPSANNRTY